ncbi:Uncharacterized protein PECH_000092 [Penicillium ucsense]|uniref:Uncharacterized protein n=1 Tax=Penicillium ucsense TaxID=2839758 RepID=A0A8J8WLG7_9EURO|nr:Uncharacterized protein PECM_003711 [Penicillium ucsense]KAF7739574.1 Uncharacterized protein PECH_000092 [Penicillium ucsense]
MEIARFNDAAITMNLCLNAAGIEYCIIGGFAMSQLSEDRETKRIDCIANASQRQIVDAVDHGVGLTATLPKNRDDYVDLQWTELDLDDKSDPVPIRVFCSVYATARARPKTYLIRPTPRQVTGETCGSGTVNFHSPVDLFKASLAAAGNRCSYPDSLDLRLLLEEFDEDIKPQLGAIALVHIGRAIRQYRHLEGLFMELGVNVDKAKIAAMNFVPFRNPRESEDDVPKDLFEKLGVI